MSVDSRQHAPMRDFVIAGPVVAILTLLLCQFVHMAIIEDRLHHAAQAAAQEATLPRATSESISAAAQRVLRQTRLHDVTDLPIVTINGQSNLLYPLDLIESGDHVEVTLGAYAADVMPNALSAIGLSLSGRKLRATASFTKR